MPLWVHALSRSTSGVPRILSRLDRATRTEFRTYASPPPRSTRRAASHRQPPFERKHRYVEPKHRHLYKSMTDRIKDLMFALQSETAPTEILRTDHLFDTMEALMEMAKTERNMAHAQQARDILLQLEKANDQGRHLVWKPSLSYYHVVLQAFATCLGGRPAAEQAHALLQHMTQRQNSKNNSSSLQSIRPDTKAFNIVMNAWSKSGEKDAGLHAEEILRSMVSKDTKDDRGGDVRLQPTAVSYATVVDAWAKSGHPDAPSRTMAYLQQLDAKDVSPALVHGVMITWIRHRRGVEAARQAEELLQLLQPPTTRSYSIVLDAWAKCEKGDGTAALRAHNILMNMIKFFQQGELNVKPNEVAFTTCIAAWAKTGQHLDRVEELIQLVEKLYKETNDHDFAPSTPLVNAILSAYSSSKLPNAVVRMEETIEKFASKCDISSYNVLLHALARRKMISKVLDVFTWLEQQERRNLQPDLISFNTLLSALSSSPARSEPSVESIWAEMESRKIKPDKVTYTLAIQVLSKGKLSLDQLKQVVAQAKNSTTKEGRYQELDKVFWISVLQACGSLDLSESSSKADGLEYAMDILETLERGPERLVSYFTYTTVLDVIHALNGEDSTVKNVFDRCASRGLVSKHVVASARRASGRRIPTKLSKEWSKKIASEQQPYLNTTEEG